MIVAAPPALDVVEAIDAAPIGGLQIRVFLLCALVAMLDGFDTQSIAFVVPAIAADWGIDGKTFGPVFSAALAGLMIGQLVLSRLSDRIGRRKTIILSTAIFGALTLATAFAQDWWTLLTLRFLAGLGLGGAIPNIMAMTSEFAPRRVRSMMIAIAFGGFPLGAVLGGFLSIRLIGDFGWHAVFVAGGAAPLLLVPVLLWLLPESPRFLLRSAPEGQALSQVMNAIVPGGVAQGRRFIADEPVVAQSGFAALFQDGRALATSLLWAVFFMSLLIIYFLMSWLPLIVKERGLPIDMAITAAIALNLGGALGGVVLGRMIDRFAPYLVLATAYSVGAIAIVALGASGIVAMQILPIAFVAGFCTIGTQTGLSAFTTTLYPTELRSTGIGTALAVGRIGSIVGPTAGGALMAAGRPIGEVFMAVAIPPVAAALVLIVFGRLVRRQNRTIV